jgi:WD40 repeat protein
MPYGKDVLSAAFACDGHRVLIGGFDGRLRSYRTATGGDMLDLGGAADSPVEVLATSRDGSTAFVSWRGDVSVAKLLEASTGRELAIVPSLPAPAKGRAGDSPDYPAAAALLDSPPRLAVAYDSGALRIYGLGGNLISALPTETFCRKAAFSPDGRWMAVAGFTSGFLDYGRHAWVSLWDVTQRRRRARLPLGDSTVSGIAVSPDGHRVAVCGYLRRGAEPDWRTVLWQAR